MTNEVNNETNHITKADYPTDTEIMANRRLVIDYLKKPGLKKAVGVLKNAVGGRCCLGHMCDALGLEPVKNEDGAWLYKGQKFGLPIQIRDALGMFNTDGAFRYGEERFQSWLDTEKHGRHSCLSNLNDESKIMPGEIALILEKMIEGGDNTPWKLIEAEKLIELNKEK